MKRVTFFVMYQKIRYISTGLIYWKRIKIKKGHFYGYLIHKIEAQKRKWNIKMSELSRLEADLNSLYWKQVFKADGNKKISLPD